MTAIRSHARAFTLIEMMVTLAILAILATMAAPHLTDYVRNSNLTSAANNLSSALAAARSEAMKRNRPTMVIAQPGGWKNGFIAFVDMDRDGAFDAAKDVLILQEATPWPAYLEASGTRTADGARPYLRYDGGGFAVQTDGSAGNLTLSLVRNDVPAATAYRQTRRLILASTGRVRICTPTSATDVTCSAASVS
jgi:type IV fimbrial biogenesis protein FimT